MGKVSFPIDLLFADAASRVVRIIHAALPGTREHWSHPICAAVLETRGGELARVRLGDEFRVFGEKIGTQTYNILRTLTEAALDDGYYGKEPLHTPPGGEKDKTLGDDRFKDHTLPDEGPDAMDSPNENWVSNFGYQRPFDTAPIYPVRMTATVDVGEFVPAMLEAAERAGVPWKPVLLNERIVRAIVRPETVGSWLHTLGLDESDRDVAFYAVTSQEGLDAIGRGFIAAGAADIARVFQVGDQNLLELVRGK
jgi:hypothetical protein